MIQDKEKAKIIIMKELIKFIGSFNGLIQSAPKHDIQTISDKLEKIANNFVNKVVNKL